MSTSSKTNLLPAQPHHDDSSTTPKTNADEEARLKSLREFADAKSKIYPGQYGSLAFMANQGIGLSAVVFGDPSQDEQSRWQAAQAGRGPPQLSPPVSPGAANAGTNAQSHETKDEHNASVVHEERRRSLVDRVFHRHGDGKQQK